MPTLLGTVVGIIWSLATNGHIKTGAIWGAVIGFTINAILSLLVVPILRRGNVQITETEYVNNQLYFILTAVGVVTGLIFWIVRAIFF